MSLEKNSKYYNIYYDHVLNKTKTKGSLGKVFDIIHDISDRRGIKHEWSAIDGDIQDEIIEKWKDIIEPNNSIKQKLKFYQKLEKKIQKILNGEMDIEDYHMEVTAKIEKLQE